MTLKLRSPCKVNLLLNILGKRADGFHELETLMFPVALYDQLTLAIEGTAIELTCDDSSLPTDNRNLVYRAATLFLKEAGIQKGVRLRLDKRIPLAAGLGGGSGNAATTLLGLNELFGAPLAQTRLAELAAALGSDVPFFLQSKPAIATGRGERIQPLDFFPAMSEAAFFLVHPGFGIASSWAYQQLQRFPAAVNGVPGRALRLARLLEQSSLRGAGSELYNSLEAPALEKYPLLAIFQDFFRQNGAMGTLMSGSGSTTFALLENLAAAKSLTESFERRFGNSYWTAVIPAQRLASS